jgi:hypothetical protein
MVDQSLVNPNISSHTATARRRPGMLQAGYEESSTSNTSASSTSKDSFHTTSNYEKEVMDTLLPYIRESARKRNMTVELITDKNEQHTLGDLKFLNAKTGAFIKSSDLKAEFTPSKNMFVEDMSNDTFRRDKNNNPFMNLGWIYKLNPNVTILYFFGPPINGYICISLDALMQWLETITPKGEMVKHSYRRVRQKKHEQLNNTTGYLVPFRDMMNVKNTPPILLGACRVKDNTCLPVNVVEFIAELEKADHRR